MKDRRIDTRKLLMSSVRLYHPEVGKVDGVINNISKGGLAIKLNSFQNLPADNLDEPLLLRPINLDVLFPVSYLRQTKSELIVKFLE